jgi:2-keto-4-pentenoate hydratase
MDIQAIASGFARAQAANATYTPPSAALQRALTLPEAYAVQRAFVAVRGERGQVVGYKSAANAPALQQRLSLATPIVGALFANGARANGASVNVADFRTLLIETELGFRTAREIEAPVKSLAELRNAISTVTPMFELADPGFGRAPMTGTDLVAANAASSGYVCGPALPALAVDMNATRVRLTKDGTTLHEAEGRDLMGDQWEALRWLVNTVLAEGYAIEPGQLLMTGALGGAHPASPGRYRAEFGGPAAAALGAVEIDVVDAR